MARQFRADVDLRNPLARSYGATLLGSADAYGDQFLVYIKNGGADFDLTGYTVKAFFVRSSTDTLTWDGTADVAGGRVYVTLPAGCYAYPGTFALAIKITKGSETMTVAIFEGTVVPTMTDRIVLNEQTMSIADLQAVARAAALEAVPKIQQGELQITTTAAGTQTATVVFPEAFSGSGVPRVFVNTRNGAPNTRMASAGTASNTQVTITAYANAAATVYVSWVAIK